MLICAVILMACNLSGALTPTPVPTSTSTPAPSFTPTNTVKPTPSELQCLSSFEHREMKEPYQKRVGGKNRYTFSTIELSQVYQEMGVMSFCIPEVLGAPFLNVDWNNTTNPSVTGRMISIGFVNLYHGQGWSDGFLLYSTYEFSTGAEFDRFASLEDWENFINGSLKETQPIAGGKGFSRFMAGVSYGDVPIYKTYVFPGPQAYIALVYEIGVYGDNDAVMVETFNQGHIPADKSTMVALFDRLAETVVISQN